MLILAADKNITNSDSIREMFETTPAFCGISGAIDNFVIPAPENTQSIDTSILEAIFFAYRRLYDKDF